MERVKKVGIIGAGNVGSTLAYILSATTPYEIVLQDKDKDRAKNECSIQPGYNDEESYNVYYITCLPWLTYAGMTHPILNGNKESCSVPRICFGRFEEKNKRYIMPFNLTVSHALVDGFPCSKALNTLKENCLRAEEFYIKN